MSYAGYDQMPYKDKLGKYYNHCGEHIIKLEKQVQENKHNKTKEVLDYIEKLLQERQIDKTHIRWTPYDIHRNPFEYFGICDSEGKIDLDRISRIEKTYYYLHYRNFDNSFVDELDDGETLDFIKSDYHQYKRFEDLYYVLNNKKAKYWYGKLQIYD